MNHLYAVKSFAQFRIVSYLVICKHNRNSFSILGKLGVSFKSRAQVYHCRCYTTS